MAGHWPAAIYSNGKFILKIAMCVCITLVINLMFGWTDVSASTNPLTNPHFKMVDDKPPVKISARTASKCPKPIALAALPACLETFATVVKQQLHKVLETMRFGFQEISVFLITFLPAHNLLTICPFVYNGFSTRGIPMFQCTSMSSQVLDPKSRMKNKRKIQCGKYHKNQGGGGVGMWGGGGGLIFTCLLA